MIFKHQLLSFFIVVAVFSSSCVDAQVSNSTNEDKKQSSILGALTRKIPTREEVLGGMLVSMLQTMHYTKKTIDDDLSSKAFKIYLERIDYGKQFLLKSDVEKLREFETKMDDELMNGKLAIVEKSSKILEPRLKMLQEFLKETLAKPMVFDKEDNLETDPEKRDYVKSEADLKSRWVKILKYEVLTRMLDKKDEQEGIGQDDDKKKKKTVVKKEDRKSIKELEKEARETVLKRYSKYFSRVLEEKRNDKLDKFYNAFARVYDPHTNYMIPEEKEDFDIDMSGQLQGIGALLREDGSFIKVDRIIPGSASWKGKQLEAGDTILAVGQSDDEPVDVVDMSLRDAVKMIRGPKGTTVKLTVKKSDGSTKVIPIVRDVVIIEESYAKSSVITDSNTGIKVGYIHLPKFYKDFNSNGSGKSCAADVKAELSTLKDNNVDGVILDLRNNGGGALDDAVTMSGLFIKKGPIVQVKNYGNTREILADRDPKVDFRGPLVVLVNKFSASASEILAAAMQDYKRAVVVGTSERTHGKGTVQALLDLDTYAPPMASKYKPLGAIKITIQMFYRITGGSTQFKGVVPDIVLPDQYAYVDSGESSMDYAIPYHEVEEADFENWENPGYKVTDLKEKSEKRVSHSPRFKKIVDSSKWYLKRKEESERSLKMETMQKDRELMREKAEEFKNEEEVKHLVVKTFIEAKDEVGKEQKENFEKTLKTDPVIEESINIVNDMIKSSMAKVGKYN